MASFFSFSSNLKFPQYSFLLFSFCYLLCHSSAIRLQSLCNDGDRSFLLQFKQSFVFDKFYCDPSTDYTKLSSWKLEDDCCNSWDGVDCDNQTGHVIGIDLSRSCLYGSINSDSPLFKLVHLTSLDLSYNNFNLSLIPGEIRSLSELKRLDLTFANFIGQIPPQFLELSKLVSLNLSQNLLMLRKPSLKDMAETLTDLIELNLVDVNISSDIPQTALSNLTFLSSLFLENCSLQGEFPSNIFQLPNLRSLSLWGNPDLTVYLPEFQVGNPLEKLVLDGTNISAQLPSSIENLRSLSFFTANGCGLRGIIPSWIGNLTRLTILDLSQNHFTGNIPSSFRNLTQLTELWLNHNQVTGPIPSWLGNFTQLIKLNLPHNEFQGPIPDSIFRLPNIQAINLQYNNLSGSLRFDSFLNTKYLSVLQLSMNQLSLVNDTYVNVTDLPKFQILGFGGCKLTDFPAFLRGQNQLAGLMLHENNIKGYVPNWIFNLERLEFLNLGYNFLTGFDHPHDVDLSRTNLGVLNLSSNQLEGSLPIPPPFITVYDVAQNKFDGIVSPLFCNLTSLLVFDLSDNNLRGNLPSCFGNLASSALVLSLRNNSLSGKIPDNFTSGCVSRLMDFSQNKIDGKLPRSLANCSKLEILNLEKNRANDVFPSWLGTLPRLRILSLKSNKLYGAIGQPLSTFEFNRLQIIDLSDNNFTGNLPLEYFREWVAMKSVDHDHLAYMEASTILELVRYLWNSRYPYFIRIVHKGTERTYNKILDFFMVVDLSSNKFEGEIPEIIGSLKALQSLNLSNNMLTGRIPSSLENLKDLEALDLSLNKLSGNIPAQLSALTFLSIFNASHNNLTGPVPRGNQFGTFQNDSFSANPGLCGLPLSKKCGDTGTLSTLPRSEDEDMESPLELNWKIVLTGVGSGLVIGITFGWDLDTRKYEWLVKKKFARWRRNRRYYI